MADWREVPKAIGELGLCSEEVVIAYLNSLERAEQILGIQPGK
jgi:hypothetical protein